MGTAQVQGDLWGARVLDWAQMQEHTLLPAYEVVFEQLDISTQTHLLDVGCGAGLALPLSRKLSLEAF